MSESETRGENLADRMKMEVELQHSRERSQSAASNPGMLRVSYLRFALAFPTWFLVWHGALLVSILLTALVHWGFGVLVLLFAYAVHLYWHRVKYQFISGCVNPGQVISVSPPLVAVRTDLSKGWCDCPVVKVLRQPLSRMAGGAPQVGDRVATAAFYQQINQNLPHWDDFSPIVIDCVTGNRGDIERVFATLEDSDWEELAEGLEQLPQPVSPGLYRVYSGAEWTEPMQTPPAEIPMLVEQHLSGLRNSFLASGGIRPEVLRLVRNYVQPQSIRQVFAVVESAKVNSDASEGFAFEGAGFWFRFEDVGQSFVRWDQVAGAFGSEAGLEIGLRDRQRIMIPKAHFLSGMRAALETMFTAIVRGE